MKAAGVLALIVSLSVVAESKVYTRCKLAKIFVKAGLDNFGGFSLGNCEIPPRLLARSTLAYENRPGGADLLHVPNLARLQSTDLLSRTCSPLSLSPPPAPSSVSHCWSPGVEITGREKNNDATPIPVWKTLASPEKAPLLAAIKVLVGTPAPVHTPVSC